MGAVSQSFHQELPSDIKWTATSIRMVCCHKKSTDEKLYAIGQRKMHATSQWFTNFKEHKIYPINDGSLYGISIISLKILSYVLLNIFVIPLILFGDKLTFSFRNPISSYVLESAQRKLQKQISGKGYQLCIDGRKVDNAQQIVDYLMKRFRGDLWCVAQILVLMHTHASIKERIDLKDAYSSSEDGSEHFMSITPSNYESRSRVPFVVNYCSSTNKVTHHMIHRVGGNESLNSCKKKFLGAIYSKVELDPNRQIGSVDRSFYIEGITPFPFSE